jgi:hypothetical protein
VARWCTISVYRRSNASRTLDSVFRRVAAVRVGVSVAGLMADSRYGVDTVAITMYAKEDQCATDAGGDTGLAGGLGATRSMWRNRWSGPTAAALREWRSPVSPWRSRLSPFSRSSAHDARLPRLEVKSVRAGVG